MSGFLLTKCFEPELNPLPGRKKYQKELSSASHKKAPGV
jgi:hypothetical protein